MQLMSATRPLGIPTQVRLPKHLSVYVALKSHLDGVSGGETIRRALEAALDREPEVLQDVGDAIPDDEQEQRGMTIPLRTIVQLIDADAVPELAATMAELSEPEPRPGGVGSDEDIPF